ncbi:hypothetical protein WICMUC_000122 [Wickerhamomyces mucosus]|uniref:DNA-directed RNA polymerase n=1 Tax=Wickerhamomyces mucosus TaxID=1378264 RepID=A0A9P8PYP6_9ASCO|nr:hypothetical protein WICMUC_000122 [Wickerhamomyces mucosus]
MLRLSAKSGRLIRSPIISYITKRSNSSLASNLHSSNSSDAIIRELKHLSYEAFKESGRGTNEKEKNNLLMGNTYSSGHDRVFREKNTDDVLRLWSLLEVCLESEQYDRALTLLDTLQPLVTEDSLPFVDDLNKYLQKWSKKVTLEEVEEFVLSWESKYETLPNGKTSAILANVALENNQDPSRFIEHYQSKGGSLKNIFSNIEIFGVNNLKLLINKYGYDKNLIAEQYRYLVEEDENGTKQSILEEDTSYFDNKNQLPKALDNGIEELKAVDSFGMKIIRHTLLALKPHLNKEIFQNLDQDLTSKLNLTVNDSNSQSQANFFKIYKSLPADLQEQFESSLDDFNLERQKFLERRAIEAAQERWKHDYEEIKNQGSFNVSKNLNATLWKWYSDMIPALTEEVERCSNIRKVDVSSLSKAAKSQYNERLKYADFMLYVSPEKLASITILELLKLNSTGGVADGMRTARAVVGVANAIELEFRSEKLLETENQIFKDAKKNKNDLKKYARLLKSFNSEKSTELQYIWPHDVKVKIGSLLISILMHVAKVQVEGVDPITKKKVSGEAPAFYHSYQYQSNVKVGVLKIHRSISSQLSVDSLIGTVQPQLLPMLVKPRPWTAWNNGGYLYSQGFLIRSKDAPEQMAYLKASSDNLQGVFDGLNVLGNTAWTINERVFNIISHFWNKGEEFLDIPKIQEGFVAPPMPSTDSDPSVIYAYKSQLKKLRTEFNNNRSTRCDANYKLEIARAFLGEKMYFPHNLDFRGRAYPLSPNLNHLGNDLSRGLLIFWKGKELGPKGLDWLKIHVSNLFGIDKAPLNERIQYVNENLDKVFKTADDPIGYQDWWTTADKPWQALASVIELANALRSPDPEKFISHQPVHQDGTCNGLQHYAALGGDVEGATQVNLVPGDRPADVYSYVANLVIKRLEKEASKGDEVAKLLKDKIKRKVVKQTVMTNVYGVTYIGATNQIDKQLTDIFPGEDTYQYSIYLTKHVFACIRELFEGAHLIQDWLALCAKIVSSSVRIDLDPKQIVQRGEIPPHMASVIWTTPLNLPIVQPYRSISRKQITTNLQTIYITDPFAMNPVDSRKQMAAFPPNFIHSLDATHMLLSAIACSKAGLEFASVHDSYWTHAGDVETMNSNLREQFIKLHEVDLIEKLKLEFDQRYRGFLQVIKIPRTSEVAKKILMTRKEISAQLGRRITLGDEIFLEKKRQALLSSENEEEINQGKSMVTTVGLIEDQDIESLKKKKATKSAKIEKVEAISDSLEEEQTGKRKALFITVLAPLRLPEIPPKGDFDVKELRNSQYFFS